MTSANGAEKHFKPASSNIPLEESIRKARELDESVRQGYGGHPHFHVIDNSTDFERKLERVHFHVKDLVSSA